MEQSESLRSLIWPFLVNVLDHSCGSNSDTLSCLRTADVDTLLTLNYNINSDGFFGTFVFVPVVDGTFIMERPTVTINKGRLNGVRMIHESILAELRFFA
jgi:carboxylesterase type B